MLEHPNALLVHQCLQAVTHGDRETLRAIWADDVVWQVKGVAPWQGEIKGAEEIFEFLAELGEVGGGGMQTDIEDVLVSGERAAVLSHVYAEFEDRVLDADFVVLLEMQGRRIRSMTSIPVDSDRMKEFWGR